MKRPKNNTMQPIPGCPHFYLAVNFAGGISIFMTKDNDDTWNDLASVRFFSNWDECKETIAKMQEVKI